MVIEIATFRLADGADETVFLEADQRVQTEFIPNLPGFMRRTTARGSNGDWVVVSLWGSEDEAEAAWLLAEGDAVHREFMVLVDPKTLEVKRYSALD